jgi:hypothetical protein
VRAEEIWSRGLGVQSGAEGELEPVAVDESLTDLLFTSGTRSTPVPPPVPVRERAPMREMLPASVDPARTADVAAERTAALVGW